MSSELGSYRLAVERWLRQVGYESVHQEMFGLTSQDIVGKLRGWLGECDAVICLIGDRYGFGPDNPTPPYGRQSYTQLEYTIAKELGLPILLLATDFDEPSNVECDGEEDQEQDDEDEVLRLLQAQFRKRVLRDQDSAKFHSKDHLLAQLATMRFPWSGHGVAHGDDADERQRQHDEAAWVLAQLFGVERDAVPGGLPGYAAAYHRGDLLEAERQAEAAIDTAGTPADAGRAGWVAGMSAAQSGRGVDALRHLRRGESVIDPQQDEALWVRLKSALGYVQLRRGLAAAAVDELTVCAEPSAKLLGEGHPTALTIRSNLAMALTRCGRAGEAEPWARRVLEARRRSRGAEHPRTISARTKLAHCYIAQGKLDEAEDEFLELRNLCVRVFGADHPRTLEQQFHLANTLAEQGELEEAAEEFLDLLRRTERAYGPDHGEVGIVLNVLAWTLYENGENDRALPHADRAVELLNQHKGRKHPDVLETRHTRASILAGLGRCDHAQREFEKLIRSRRQAFGEHDARTLGTRCDLAAMLATQPDTLDLAAEQTRSLWEEARQHLGEQHPITVRCDKLLAVLAPRQSAGDAKAST